VKVPSSGVRTILVGPPAKAWSGPQTVRASARRHPLRSTARCRPKLLHRGESGRAGTVEASGSRKRAHHNSKRPDAWTTAAAMTASNTALKGLAGRVRPAGADPPYKVPANEQNAGLGSPTITLGAPRTEKPRRVHLDRREADGDTETVATRRRELEGFRFIMSRVLIAAALTAIVSARSWGSLTRSGTTTCTTPLPTESSTAATRATTTSTLGWIAPTEEPTTAFLATKETGTTTGTTRRRAPTCATTIIATIGAVIGTNAEHMRARHTAAS
jgi:hypothetical protein